MWRTQRCHWDWRRKWRAGGWRLKNTLPYFAVYNAQPHFCVHYTQGYYIHYFAHRMYSLYPCIMCIPVFPSKIWAKSTFYPAKHGIYTIFPTAWLWKLRLKSDLGEGEILNIKVLSETEHEAEQLWDPAKDTEGETVEWAWGQWLTKTQLHNCPRRSPAL